jgi:chemotaxis protein methyltransferase CheR
MSNAMKKRKKALPVASELQVEETEIRLLLEGVRNCYGFDFRDYAEEPLKRRLWGAVHDADARTVSAYQDKVLHDPACLEQLLRALTAHELSLFEDPPFWEAFRAIVVPMLRTYPSVQIWVPGCATGEDAYGIAIVLHEEGVLPRTRIYATDLSEGVLQQARTGSFPRNTIAQAEESYAKSGGTKGLSQYFRLKRTHAVAAPFLGERMVFAEHSLATDGPFNEFQVIVCRSALQVLNEWLKDRVQAVFFQSLSRFGILALGAQETPKSLSGEQPYERLPGSGNLYRKMS